MAATSAEDLVDGGHGGVGVYAVLDEIGQGLAGQLVVHVEELALSPSGRDVELVVEGPHVIRVGGHQAISRSGRLPHSARL